MACAVCEHCLSPLLTQEKTAIREGLSYHKKCLKCYVCSETNLHNAEVFKGVIFCFSCAQRIFQGCASVRKTRQQVNSRLKRSDSRSRSYAKQIVRELKSTKKQKQRDPTKRSRSKQRRKRESNRPQEKQRDRHFNSVIERAQLGTQSTSDSAHSKETNKTVVQSKPAVIAELLQVEKVVSYNVPPQKSVKVPSVEIGVTTDVTQLLLKQINDYMQPIAKSSKPSPKINMVPYDLPNSRSPSPHRVKKHRKPQKKRPNSPKPPKPKHKPVYSDLRIAELGVSTEIANMALRKKSEVPVIIKSDRRPLDTRSLSIPDQESDESGNKWMDSAYSTLNESNKPNCLDRRLRSILKIPYKFFKRNILTRSSWISVLMSNKRGGKVSLKQKLKMLFYEEITDHRGRGIRRLYSTINRRKIPYKLGWMDYVVNQSNCKDRFSDGRIAKNRCRHLNSHSYRCMRSQALRLAGPTSSELAHIRKKIKSIAVPKFMKTIANFFMTQPPEENRIQQLQNVESPLRRGSRPYVPTLAKYGLGVGKTTLEENRIQQLQNAYDIQTVYQAQTDNPVPQWNGIGKTYDHLYDMLR